MATGNKIILTKSPYFIYEVGSSGFTSTAEIRIWSGDISTDYPSEPTYTLSKQTISSIGTDVYHEISSFIQDEFNHLSDVYSTPSSFNLDSLWVNVKTYGGNINRDDTFLALDGYSEFQEGVNYELTESVLINERIVYHISDINLRIPFYCDGNNNANQIVFRKGTNEVFTRDLTASITSDKSYDKIQYIELDSSLYQPGSINNVIVKNSVGTIIDTIIVKVVECTKYIPYTISFINKFGVQQQMVFSLVSKKKGQVKRESMNKKILKTNGGVSYNTTEHQFRTYNSILRESITLNTNYIDESLNDTLGDLISSDYVWVSDNNNTLPVTVSTESLDYKKGINNGLINYTINFNYAFNKRNTIQ